VRILVVDDHEIARDGMKIQLEQLNRSARVDEAGSCDEAIELSREHIFDLVLLDLHLPDSQGLGTLKRYLATGCRHPTVVVSGTSDVNVVFDAVDAGAVGFIPKRASRPEIVGALQLVVGGGIYIPSDALRAQMQESERRPQADELLTPRQLEVLRGAIAGKSNKEIAAELELSAHTVKSHLSSVMRVLGANNRTEAVFKSAALGIAVFSRNRN